MEEGKGQCDSCSDNPITISQLINLTVDLFMNTGEDCGPQSLL